MASAFKQQCLLLLLFQIFSLLSLFHSAFGAENLTSSAQEQPLLMQYHHGPLLTGQIPVNLIWYGNFSSSQRAVVTDFITSLSSSTSQNQPSVDTWWKAIENYYSNSKTKPPSLLLQNQILDENYSFGKSLRSGHIVRLATKGTPRDAINIVLTASDVAVEGFCTSRCGIHKSFPRGAQAKKKGRFAYIWVGNPQTQCPGQCAWPFHKPISGPQVPPLVAPNNDVGLDGMIVNIATLLAGTVTNPYGNGYFQGPKDAPLEAATACLGVYGKGAYPGYAGKLLVDSSTGASYNAYGANGRKYLLPALFDPSTSSCLTLV